MENNSIGAKILALRKANGCTQSDLGVYLNISYQAVSKWERDESCPDFDTLSRIAQYFNVPISYFEKGGEIAVANAATNETVVKEETKEMLGMCKDCGKVVYRGEEFKTEPQIICKACEQRRRKVAEAKAAEIRREVERKEKEKKMKELARREEIIRSRNKGLTWGTVIGGALCALGFFGSFGEGFGSAIGGIFSSLLVGVLIFSFIAQLFWDGAVADCVFMGGKIVGTPGIIFTFDLDGFIFLIAMKILFAILRFIIYILTLLFFALVGFVISPFTFIPALRRVNSGDLVD